MTRTWSPITYYSVYNGQPSCFVGTGVYLCFTHTVIVDWFAFTQCSVGTWSMQFYENGAQVGSGRFHLKPTLPPFTTPAWNQGASPHPGPDQYASGPYRISQAGCLLASYAEMLRYHGVRINPPQPNPFDPGPPGPPILDLNQWLRDHRGYVGGLIDA